MSRRVPEGIGHHAQQTAISIYLVVCDLVQSVYGKRSQDDDSHEAGEDAKAEWSFIVLADPDFLLNSSYAG